MAAAACAFETYELLEWTLLHLPLRDLLLAERVCKTWQQVVKKSDRIEKALFRRAAPCNVNFLMPGLACSGLDEPFCEQVPSPACYINPFINQYVDCLRIVLQLRQSLFEHNEESESRSALQSVEASWRKMLLLQPPPASTAFICKGRMKSRQKLEADCMIRMNDSSGHRGQQIDMGYIANFLDEHLQKCPLCPTIEERACKKEEQKAPAWSMCIMEDPLTLDVNVVTGWECVEKLGGCKGERRGASAK
ncbi:hypothetical protein M409DRAFT_54319 [Zasmidium cellare ATCC 36951]|uniref:F-box domain-containing protein n=1 Tax=Zasmidium cellare ATCC 36951 TaxID=1080233 RepID=A0A6A6CNS2_ZASCE|nr:uncharacterized protein M409DRAFT_54319 [Zasmidium cellare ATCC 36951]KAF2167116.1 hypothetical protein M409DRAFT_54319 [Zasmidium cellare ATCC 36951]